MLEKTENKRTRHSTVACDATLNAFLDSKEGQQQIPDTKWMASRLRKHRVTIWRLDELFTFAENHPKDFQVLTQQEIDEGVESIHTIYQKYWDSEWLAKCEGRPPTPRRLRNMDGSPLEWRRPGLRDGAPVGNIESPDVRHDGTFNAFLEIEESHWLARSWEDELVLNIVRECGIGGWRIRRWVELERVWMLVDYPDGVPSLDTMSREEQLQFTRRHIWCCRMPMWQKYLRWRDQLEYGRRRLPDRKHGIERKLRRAQTASAPSTGASRRSGL
ncbi:hypothetical protein ACVIQT_002092 [Bradyrhizobium diazoefficiens]